MANLSDLNQIIQDLFDVIGTIINEVVNLMTGDLLILAIVGAFVAFIIGVIYMLFAYIGKTMTFGTKMKKK